MLFAVPGPSQISSARRGRASVDVREMTGIAVATTCALLLAGCGLVTPSSGQDADPEPEPLISAAVPLADADSPSARPNATRDSVAPPSRKAAGVAPADRAAGLRSAKVPKRGTGRLATVPGDVAAPGKGRVMRVRVQVEKGLDIDRPAFARFVMKTLNDDRSWSNDGVRSFARTDGDADFRVVLASPETSAAMCRPLQTNGRLSCRSGDAAVLTMYRWVKAIPEYDDRTAYRQYVVNHEVGHLLGRGHESCPGKGRRAPLMMQQTKGLLGCRPNPWPFP